MDDCIHSLGEAQVFFVLDALLGYWKVRTKDEGKKKISFISHLGTYRYSRLAFSLQKASAVSQRALNIILSRG